MLLLLSFALAANAAAGSMVNEEYERAVQSASYPGHPGRLRTPARRTDRELPSYPAPGVARPGTCEGRTADLGAGHACRQLVSDSEDTILTMGGRLYSDVLAEMELNKHNANYSPLLRESNPYFNDNLTPYQGRSDLYQNRATGKLYFRETESKSYIPECFDFLRKATRKSYETGKTVFKRDLTKALPMCSVAHTIAWEATLEYPRLFNDRPTFLSIGQGHEQRIEKLLRMHPDAFDKHTSEFVQLLEEQETFANGVHAMSLETSQLRHTLNVEQLRRMHGAILTILLEHGANRPALYKAVDKFNQGDRKHGTPERREQLPELSGRRLRDLAPKPWYL